MRHIPRVFTLALGTIGLAAGSVSAQDNGRTTAHGVYSEAQAARGEEVYWNVCSECHVEDDFGAPFMQTWNGQPIKDLFDEIYGTMPEDNPGGLPQAQYVDVVAYLFSLNGMPMGESELSHDHLAEIAVDWRASYDDVEAPSGSEAGESTEASASDDSGDAADERTTAHGVYNDEQANRGEEVYWNICSECHVEDDFSASFMESWSGATVKDLLEEIQATMPEDNPGGLPVNRYLDVISFMFKLNGLPTGDSEMGEGDIGSITIDLEPSGSR